MLQPCRGPDLREESLGAECLAQIGMQDLDGDITVVLDVVREIDRGHAALAQFAFDAVAIGQCFRQTDERVGHRALVAKATARLMSLKWRPPRAIPKIALAMRHSMRSKVTFATSAASSTR